MGGISPYVIRLRGYTLNFIWNSSYVSKRRYMNMIIGHIHTDQQPRFGPWGPRVCGAHAWLPEGPRDTQHVL